ncbi:MAG: hypothetical protein ACRECV_04180, partial [Xanthobacteraceae bacterium]
MPASRHRVERKIGSLPDLIDLIQQIDAVLMATIHFIFGLPHQGNNLYLLSRCTGLGERYQGSFPKCNSVGQAPHIYAQTLIGQQTEAELIHWVNEQINANF